MKMSDAMARLRGELRYEPLEKRVRAELGGRLVLDTTRAVLVWEPRRVVPTYAVPARELWGRLTPADPAPGAGGSAATAEGPGLLHPGIPFSVHSAPGESLGFEANGQARAAAAFRPADPDLTGYVVLDFAAFDRWFEEDEPVHAHPRDPYHRVDAQASSRHVLIAYEGRTIVDTTRSTLVYETSLPVRFYVPRADVLVTLVPGDTRTYCPYKGEASYFSLAGRNDVAWSYEHPLPDMTPLAGLIAFYDDVMDVTVDGVRRERPDTPVARLLRAEFGV